MLDPTYLRYIYDNLIKGNIHPDNAAELPNGLIGLYEEAFEENFPIIKRQQLLQRFALFALLKKEVSAAFVCEVLGETEDDIQEFISTYSAWFNSPESGKYQLYHERLKVYLLQKLSEGEINDLHEKLITRLEQAIKEQQADEFEFYALEFLAGHLGVSAMLYGDGKKLIDLSYSLYHWQRQLKISKSYTWTKNGLKEVMSWASKYNEDEVIECGLQMVDLHHQEQNAAPQIVALVAEGDFDSALKRIEQFGGSDKEGLQRKFILYMLCLMELTLLDSKDKPFRKEGIEKLLKHLDEQLPVDDSLLNWDDFFSSYLIFQITSVMAEIELDYLIIYKRTEFWTSEWVTEMGPYSDYQFKLFIDCVGCINNDLWWRRSELLRYISEEYAKHEKIDNALECALEISDDSYKGSALHFISIKLANQGSIDKAFDYASYISNDYWWCMTMKDISSALVKHMKIEEASTAINKSLECAREIIDDFYMISSILDISIELNQQGKINDAAILMKEVIEYTQETSDENDKIALLKKISTELAKQGMKTEALNCVRLISSEFEQNKVIMDISIELTKQEKIEEAQNYIIEITNNQFVNIAMKQILTEQAKKGKIKEASEIARGISDEFYMISSLLAIGIELYKQGKFNEADLLTDEVIENTIRLTKENDKIDLLKKISIELAKQGKNKQSLRCIRYLNSDFEMSLNMNRISSEFSKQGNYFEAFFVMQENLKYTIKYSKTFFIKTIAIKLSNQGKSKEALDCVLGISNKSGKNSVLKYISCKLAQQGKLELAFIFARFISFDSDKSFALNVISNNFAKQGKLDEAKAVLKESIQNAKNIKDYLSKGRAFKDISSELYIQGKLEEALATLSVSQECVLDISDYKYKSIMLTEISNELTKQEKVNEAASLIKQALEYARLIDLSREKDKSFALGKISIELSNKGEFNEAIILAKSIIDYLEKCTTLNKISIELNRRGKFNEATDIVQEAIACARMITIKWQKTKALNEIALEQAKHGNLTFAEEIISLEIPEMAKKQSCWKTIAQNIIKENGLQNAFQKTFSIKNIEARLFYLSGLAEGISIYDFNIKILIKVLPLLKNNPMSIEHLLYTHAINELFFENSDKQKIQKFNRTLNLQWAVDLKKELGQN